MSKPTEFDGKVIDEFRANEGRVGGMFEGMSLLLLHHVGAKSGEKRINPVAYLRDGECYVIFASKAGAPTNPAWYHNLKAAPNILIEVGNETLNVVAHEVGGEERDRLFRAQVEQLPQFAEYAEQTERIIPAMVLTPKQG